MARIFSRSNFSWLGLRGAAPWRRLSVALLLGWGSPLGVAAGQAAALPPPPALAPCWLQGVVYAARCGVVRRALDPAQPGGRQIDVHFAVLPALARRKNPDPIFFFAGGPGQSAIDAAAIAQAMLARLGNRRDLVLIDQRGTGRSAPLTCDEESPLQPLSEQLDETAAIRRLDACRERLMRLPHGDLRFFTTPIAAADADAVRAALGAERVNLAGGSYGTRVALEYLRQFAPRVRRVVLDGVAPPDQALPWSMAENAQAALDALFADCVRDVACARRYPDLPQRWQTLLAGLPRTTTLTHPLTGRAERVTLTRETVLGWVRQPLYAAALTAGLPLAISEAAQGRDTALFGLGQSMSGAKGKSLPDLALGMHFSVVCSEDMPRVEEAGAAAAPVDSVFAATVLRPYREICARWPRGALPAAFYTVAPSPVPVLALSGAIDPATPPRHAERVVRALGPGAVHRVAAHTGHGALNVPCLRDLAERFIDNPDDAAALADARATTCAERLPRPGAFVAPLPEALKATP